MIQLENLSKTYIQNNNAIKAVDSVNLSVKVTGLLNKISLLNT